MTAFILADTAQLTEGATWDLANRVVAVANATETLNLGGSHYHITVADSANASELASLGVTVIDTTGLLDNVAVADTVTFVRTNTLADSGQATDSVTTTAIRSVTVADTAAASETVGAPYTAVVVDSAQAAETVLPVRPLTVTDTASATDAASGARLSGLTIAEQAAASDAHGAPAVQTSVDAASAAEIVSATRRAFVIVEDSAQATDTDLVGAKIATTVSDVAVASEVASGTWVATATVDDTAEAEDFIRLPASAIPAFWCNSATGAVATWDGLPFNSLVEADGKLYAAGVDGIFALEAGADDNGTDVAAEVLYDLVDFGSRQRKRLDSIYIDGNTDGAFTVTVTQADPKLASYRYVARRPGNAMGNHRAQPGQGLRAVHYRIGLTCAQDFGVNSVSVAARELGRRI